MGQGDGFLAAIFISVSTVLPCDGGLVFKIPKNRLRVFGAAFSLPARPRKRRQRIFFAHTFPGAGSSLPKLPDNIIGDLFNKITFLRRLYGNKDNKMSRTKDEPPGARRRPRAGISISKNVYVCRRECIISDIGFFWGKSANLPVGLPAHVPARPIPGHESKTSIYKYMFK
jgi:hypothetical protein